MAEKIKTHLHLTYFLWAAEIFIWFMTPTVLGKSALIGNYTHFPRITSAFSKNYLLEVWTTLNLRIYRNCIRKEVQIIWFQKNSVNIIGWEIQKVSSGWLRFGKIWENILSGFNYKRSLQSMVRDLVKQINYQDQA